MWSISSLKRKVYSIVFHKLTAIHRTTYRLWMSIPYHTFVPIIRRIFTCHRRCVPACPGLCERLCLWRDRFLCSIFSGCDGRPGLCSRIRPSLPLLTVSLRLRSCDSRASRLAGLLSTFTPVDDSHNQIYDHLLSMQSNMRVTYYRCEHAGPSMSDVPHTKPGESAMAALSAQRGPFGRSTDRDHAIGAAGLTHLMSRYRQLTGIGQLLTNNMTLLRVAVTVTVQPRHRASVFGGPGRPQRFPRFAESRQDSEVTDLGLRMTPAAARCGFPFHFLYIILYFILKMVDTFYS